MCLPCLCMTILVTGATGNVGRRVVDGLVGAGQRVRVMVRDPQAARFAAGVEVVRGDFARPQTWAAALRGVERVHLFPWARGLVEAAAEAGVRRFVVHSAGAVSLPVGAGGSAALREHLAEERIGHREVESAVEATGAEWTHVRPGLLAVNALGWAGSIRAERVVRAPYAAAGYPLVHEADVAEVAVAALLTDGHAGRAYLLTGPAKVTQAEQVAAIGAAIGADIRFEELDPEEARARWRADGHPGATVDWMLALLQDALDGSGVLPPTDTFERLTGRPPRTFAQWAADHAKEFTA
jgi:uncharacterized protein YbjT (DUF2867 family)